MIRNQRSAIYFLAPIILLAAFIRFYQLTGQSLWYDEGFTLFYSGASTFGGTFYRLAHSASSESAQPLYFFLLQAWRRIFGSGEWAVRSLSAAFGVVDVLLLYFVGKRLAGEKHGLLAAGFGALSAFLVLYAQEARPYSFLAGIALVQLWLLLRIREGGAPAGVRVAFWLSFAVSLYASVLFACFAAGLCLADLPQAFRQRRILATWAGSVVCAIAGGLAILLQPGGEGSISHARQSLFQNAAFSLYGAIAGTTLGPPLSDLRGSNRLAVFVHYWPAMAGVGIFAVLFFGVIVWIARTSPRGTAAGGARFLAIVFIASFAASFAFAFATRLNWQPRHSFFLAVLVCLMLPYCLTGAEASVRWAGWAAAGLYVVLNLVAIYHHDFDAAYAQDDYRGVARYVRQHPEFPSVLMWGNPELLGYYGDPTTLDGRRLDKNATALAIRNATSGAPRVLVVVDRDFYWDGSEPLDAALRRVYDIKSVVTFPYFKIYDAELPGTVR